MDVRTTQTLAPLMMWLVVGCLSGGCGAAMEGDEGEPVLAAPGWVRIRGVGGAGGVTGAGGCFGYERTGPDYVTPHVVVGEEVWRAAGGAHGDVRARAGGEVVASWREPAACVQGSRVEIEAGIVWPEGFLAESGQVAVSAVLRSATDEALAWSWGGRAWQGVRRGDRLAWRPPALPGRVDTYHLELTWTITATTAVRPQTVRVVTTHPMLTTWRAPRPEAPLYKKMLWWSSTWAAGEWPDGPAGSDVRLESERRISEAILAGFSRLDREGFMYGAYFRPDREDRPADMVDLFMDYRMTACGEFKHGLRAPIEYQGVDAQWGALHFLEHGADRLSFYKTRKTAALGRFPQHWFHTNHAFVMVNGRVYDGVYNRSADSIGAYEDDLFGWFCLGKNIPCDSARALPKHRWCKREPDDFQERCIANPPGYDPALGFTLLTGESYD